MKKKVLALLLVVALVASLAVVFAGCDPTDEDKVVTMDNIKIGMICLHDENSTYDKNFIDAMNEAAAALGLREDQVIIVTGIPESDECYQKACELADEGCDIIFADSFGHEDYMIKAAKKYPNVLFAHATGTKAHTENLPNFVNAFASIYEGRYMAGVAAGLKLNEMIANGDITADQAKMGYVGAFTYAEVMSGYTSFYLGAKSVCPTVTMDVTFTGSWYDETAENNAAKSLIAGGCVLISQHADSMGAPNACEEEGVPNVSYNGSTAAACPNTFIVSSRINWAPYYTYLINSLVNGTEVAKDWTGTIATGSVVLTAIGSNAPAAGTQAKLDEVKAGLQNGTINVFDTANWTVDGQTLTSYLADVDSDAAYAKDTEAIENGVFFESKHRSAPYFDVEIDGINLLDRDYGDDAE
ncbi:MAG: BMP family ABC transporter substrate-binding protein [Clostridia bacterium]|nr:BMP family ABC transporter substrate-binding protein [Clostridia bacterium]